VDAVLEQILLVGNSLSVFISAFDPEGFNTFIASAVSSADTIVTVAPDGQGNVILFGVSPGQAIVTVEVSDGGATSAISFPVIVTAEVAAENQAPLIEPISNQTVEVGVFLPITVLASDPEGGDLSLQVASDDPNIAAAQVVGAGINILGVAVGQTGITVIVTDPQGASASAVFLVTVTAVMASPPPPTGVDIASLPVIENLSGAKLSAAQNALSANAEALPNSFIVVGDTTPNDLLADAADGLYDLSAAPELEAVLQAYLNQATDGGNVLNGGGVRSSNNGWRTADILNPANNPAGCEVAPNPFACAVIYNMPSLALILTGRNDLLGGQSPEAFEADVRAVLAEARRLNVVPVLATLAGDPASTDAYNQVLVRLADELGVALWNLAALIPAEQVNADLTPTSLGAGQNDLLTAENVAAYGAAKRNLSLLQLLQALRASLGLG
jgi:hypothetical protein